MNTKRMFIHSNYPNGLNGTATITTIPSANQQRKIKQNTTERITNDQNESILSNNNINILI